MLVLTTVTRCQDFIFIYHSSSCFESSPLLYSYNSNLAIHLREQRFSNNVSQFAENIEDVKARRTHDADHFWNLTPIIIIFI